MRKMTHSTFHRFPSFADLPSECMPGLPGKAKGQAGDGSEPPGQPKMSIAQSLSVGLARSAGLPLDRSERGSTPF